MSASPPSTAAQSQKRPFEEPSSPSGPEDQPDAKRPALDKIVDAPEDAIASADVIQGSAELVADGSLSTKEAAPVIAQNGTTSGNSIVSDAPTAGGPSPQTVLETQPIQSTTTVNGRATSEAPTYQHQDETGWLHMRAIISSQEAATCIGKGGENVTQIRKMSGAKCTVSDYTRGAVERILTVSGLVDAVAKVSCMHIFQSALLIWLGFRPHHPHTQQ